MPLNSSLSFNLPPSYCFSNEAATTVTIIIQCMVKFSSSFQASNPTKFVLSYSRTHSVSRFHCFSMTADSSGAGKDVNLIGEERVLDLRIDGGGCDNSADSGDCVGGDGGGGGGGGGDESDRKKKRIMRFEEVMKEAEMRGVQLPADMVEAARTTGIREMFD